MIFRHISVFICLLLFAGNTVLGQGTWTWVWGGLNSTSLAASGLGVFSPGNSPGQRYAAACWTDSSGHFWRYGGGGEDLWEYDPAINQWALIHGALQGGIGAVYGTQGVPGPNVTPGDAEFGNPAWEGHNNDLWLYSVGFTDDLWRFDIGTGMWTWVHGSAGGSAAVYGVQGVAAPGNTPGGVNETDATWVDSNGDLWLFNEFAGVLWRYDVATNMWTWVKGTPGGTPVYGTIGSPGPNNTPGVFSGCPSVGTLYTMWIDSGDNLWMIVNRPNAQIGVEMWRYSIFSNEWTCMRVDQAAFGANQFYPTACLESPGIFPVPRTELRTRWLDACDNLWIFGGGNFCGLGNSSYNDLWRYNPNTNQWSWIRGGIGAGVFGTQGIPNALNQPNPAYGGQHWVNEDGFWYAGGGNSSSLPTHHLWRYAPDSVNAGFTWTDSCLTAAFTNASTSGCNSIRSYAWDFGDPGSGSSNTDTLPDPTHIFSAPGTYSVTLIVENCTWDSDTIVHQVTINCGLFVTLNSDTICEGDCINLQAVPFAGTAPYTYQWNNGIGTTTAGPVTVCPTSTTTWSVTVTDFVGDSAITTGTIWVLPQLSVSLGNDTSVCSGAFVLDAGPAPNYLWSDNSTQQTLVVTSGGQYWVEVSNGACSARDTINIGLGNTEVDLGNDTILCQTGSLTLNVQNTGASYLWQDGSNGQTFQVSNSGLYWVEVDSSGCTSRDSILVGFSQVNAAIGASDTIGCLPLAISFSDLSATSTGNLVSWAWDFGDASFSNLQNPNHQYSQPGIYMVTVIVENDLGCSDTANQLIEVYDTPNADFNWQGRCFGEPVTFSDQSTLATGSLVSWSWSFGDGGTGSGQQVSHAYASTGVYSVQLVVQSSQGCADTLIETVVVYPEPEALFEVDFACEGDSSWFTDLSTIASGSIVSWTWDFGDGGSSSSSNPVHVYQTSGTFLVSLTVVSDQGCSSTYQLSVERPPAPLPPIPEHDTVCIGEVANVGALNQQVGADLFWYLSPGDLVPIHQGPAYQTPPLQASGIYYVAAVSPDGCHSPLIPVYAVVVPPPSAQVVASSYEVELPNTIVEFTVLDSNSQYSYFWDFGDGQSSNLISPVHQYTEEGNYSVTLTVVNAAGCIAVYQLSEIIVTLQYNLFVPSAFTPDEDGLNDVFEVSTLMITSLEVDIYDRWGKLIYHSGDVNFKWNGRSKDGRPFSEGAYVFKIQAIAVDGSVLNRVGTVTLYR